MSHAKRSWALPCFLFILMLVGFCLFNEVQGQEREVFGQVLDEKTGVPLAYANVSVSGSLDGSTTDEMGRFKVRIPEGETVLVVSFIGFGHLEIPIAAGPVGPVTIKMKQQNHNLTQVKVVAEQSRQRAEFESSEMSRIHLPIAQLKGLPALGGEMDVIKVIQLLPGVSSGGEGGTAMFVRGGDADQNLVLMDDAVVYNYGHLLGFYSVFNPDALKDVTLIKGAFPARYGGRLSSVLDIRTDPGRMDKIGVKGGIGLLSSRLTVEGPVGKNTNFQFSGRRTYIDKVLALAKTKLPYYFYDLNGKISTRISSKDRITISAYYGQDVLRLKNQDVGGDTTLGNTPTDRFNFGFTLGNYSNTLRWDRQVNKKLLTHTSLVHTQFNYDINAALATNKLLIRSNVRDLGLKNGWKWYRNDAQEFQFGLEIFQHDFRPNVVQTEGDVREALKSNKGKQLITQEWALYGATEWKVIPGLFTVSGGLRFSGLNTGGHMYFNPEPRMGLRYTISENDALKGGYARMAQYMHLVSSSTLALPTDLWYPVSKNIKPQTSDQLSAGYTHLFSKLNTSFTVEGFYKWMYNLTEYREGANLILNDEFEEELLAGTGKSYGLEALLRKEKGKLTGWLGYTLAWSTRQYDDLNEGLSFYSKYDRRHNFSIVGLYEFSKRWSVSAVWVYASGARFTAQIGRYIVPNASGTGVEIIPVYSARNAISLSPTHRLDVNIILKNKPHKRLDSEWHFGAYNVYNRTTPYRVEVVGTGEGNYQYQQPGLFGFIPSVAYNFKF